LAGDASKLKLTRREFLKVSLVIPILPALGVKTIEAPTCTGPADSQPWGFPLAFPAYFPTAKQDHRLYLPIVAKE